MNYTIRVNITRRQVQVNMPPNAPEQLRFTIVRVFSGIERYVPEHGLSFGSFGTMRWTITPALGAAIVYKYELILDFELSHTKGLEQTVYFTNTGIRDYIQATSDNPVDESLPYQNPGSYFISINGNWRTNLTSTEYWSLRKALPYPLLE